MWKCVWYPAPAPFTFTTASVQSVDADWSLAFPSILCSSEIPALIGLLFSDIFPSKKQNCWFLFSTSKGIILLFLLSNHFEPLGFVAALLYSFTFYPLSVLSEPNKNGSAEDEPCDTPKRNGWFLSLFYFCDAEQLLFSETCFCSLYMGSYFSKTIDLCWMEGRK